MASRPTLDRLYSLIENSRERSISGKYFIRPSKVREIFKLARINSAVAELGCDGSRGNASVPLAKFYLLIERKT
jgi:hypothetical protein